MLQFDKEPETGGGGGLNLPIPEPGWKPEVWRGWETHRNVLGRLCLNPVVQERINHFAAVIQEYANPPVAEGRLTPDYEAAFKRFHDITNQGLNRPEREVTWWMEVEKECQAKGVCTLQELRCCILRKAVGKVLRDICLGYEATQSPAKTDASQRCVELVLSLLTSAGERTGYDTKSFGTVGAFADLISDPSFSFCSPSNPAAEILHRAFFFPRGDKWSHRPPVLEQFGQQLVNNLFNFNRVQPVPDSADFKAQRARYGLLGLDIWEQIQRGRKNAHAELTMIGADSRPSSFGAFSARGALLGHNLYPSGSRPHHT